MVERCVRDAEAARSNRATPTGFPAKVRAERESNETAKSTTFEFLKAAITDGAIERFLQQARTKGFETLNRRTRDLNLTGTYLYTPATSKEISALYSGLGLGTHEGVRFAYLNTIRRLWEASSEKTKQRFPLKKIGFRKTYHSELFNKVVKLLTEGHKPAQILQEVEVSQKIPTSRILKEFKLEAPGVKGSLDRLSQRLKNARTNKEIKEILGGLTRGFYNKYLKEKEKPVIFITELLFLSGLRLKNTKVYLVAQILEESGIPVGRIENSFIKNGRVRTMTYYPVAMQHKEKALRVLRGKRMANYFRLRE